MNFSTPKAWLEYVTVCLLIPVVDAFASLRDFAFTLLTYIRTPISFGRADTPSAEGKTPRTKCALVVKLKVKSFKVKCRNASTLWTLWLYGLSTRVLRTLGTFYDGMNPWQTCGLRSGIFSRNSDMEFLIQDRPSDGSGAVLSKKTALLAVFSDNT